MSRKPSNCIWCLETAKSDFLHPKVELPRLCRPVIPRVCGCVCFGVVLDGGIPKELNDFLQILEGLETFRFSGNPWVEPPAAVLRKACKRRIPAIRSYFVDLYREKRVISRSLKVVLVGREGAGKTRCSQMLPILAHASLLHQLQHESPVLLSCTDISARDVSCIPTNGSRAHSQREGCRTSSCAVGCTTIEFRFSLPVNCFEILATRRRYFSM